MTDLKMFIGLIITLVLHFYIVVPMLEKLHNNNDITLFSCILLRAISIIAISYSTSYILIQ